MASSAFCLILVALIAAMGRVDGRSEPVFVYTNIMRAVAQREELSSFYRYMELSKDEMKESVPSHDAGNNHLLVVIW